MAQSSLHPHIQSDSESGEDSLVTVTALIRFDSDLFAQSTISESKDTAHCHCAFQAVRVGACLAGCAFHADSESLAAPHATVHSESPVAGRHIRRTGPGSRRGGPPIPPGVRFRVRLPCNSSYRCRSLQILSLVGLTCSRSPLTATAASPGPFPGLRRSSSWARAPDAARQPPHRRRHRPPDRWLRNLAIAEAT